MQDKTHNYQHTKMQRKGELWSPTYLLLAYNCKCMKKLWIAKWRQNITTMKFILKKSPPKKIGQNRSLKSKGKKNTCHNFFVNAYKMQQVERLKFQRNLIIYYSTFTMKKVVVLVTKWEKQFKLHLYLLKKKLKILNPNK